MQAVAAHRDYTRIFHNCQAKNLKKFEIKANNETFLNFFTGAEGLEPPRASLPQQFSRLCLHPARLHPFAYQLLSIGEHFLSHG